MVGRNNEYIKTNMKLNISDTLNAQINSELWSSYLFLSMSVNASSKGFKGVAHWFYVQSQKENLDAKKLMDYLNSIGSKVYLYPIEGVPAEWESPLEMFKHKLQHDIKISRLIYVASTIAEENNDNDTLDFLTNFANEQKKEENISRNMIMAFDSVKDDEFAFTLLDKELGEREL